MKAVVHDRYGPPDVLRVEDVADPPAPGEDELLVRVHATTVNRTDCHVRAAKPFLWRFFAGFLRPKHRVLGSEFAGEVVEIGSNVTRFAVGDRVFGVRAYMSEGFGCHAELVAAREQGPLAHMPERSTFQEAAPVCDGALSALAFVRAAELQEGRSVLVYGASGSIGTATVQLAAHAGAHVTAVCNTKNLDLVRSLGADRVVDYTKEDFTKNGERYDVVVDAVGKHSFMRSRGSLEPDGLFFPTDGLHNFALARITGWTGGRKVVFAIPRYRTEDVEHLAALVGSGAYRPVVDRTYPLEDVVEATRYVETGQKTGNVVLTLPGSGSQ